jgi:hypothetical protein
MKEYYKINESKKLIACIGDVGSTITACCCADILYSVSPEPKPLDNLQLKIITKS